MARSYRDFIAVNLRRQASRRPGGRVQISEPVRRAVATWLDRE